MARRRYRRKDLKRPDEFVSRGRALLDWGLGNMRLVGWALGGVALLLLLIGGFFSLRSARVRQANEDLTHALNGFRAGRYGQAAGQLADVASRWQSTDVGRIAGLYAAHADVRANNLDTATTLFQDAVTSGESPPYLRQQALLSLGFALERKGDAPAAAARYAEAAAVEGPYTSMALLGEARCREQAGEREKARELYERFVREFSQAPDAAMVQAKIEAMQG